MNRKLKKQLPAVLRPMLALSAVLIPASAGAAAPTFYVREVWVALPSQQVSLVYEADMGFPLGDRSAETVLDCKTGKVTTRGYDRKAGFDRPAQAPEDKEGAAALLATKVIQSGSGVLSFKQNNDSLRFTCKNGVVVTDFSGYATRTRGQSFYRDTDANVALSVTEGMFPTALTVPGFVVTRSDGKFGTSSLSLSLNGESLRTAAFLTGASTDYVFRSEREALFLLEGDGKTLRPIAYGGKELGVRKVVPLKTGKSGTILTFFYAPDYNNPANWQKTTVDFQSFQTYSTTITKPANLLFGK